MNLSKTTNSIIGNKRITYFLAVFITILLGLASRKYGSYLPLFFAENAGDALWAMMVYFGFRLLLVRSSILILICFSIFFCFAIEFSQLYQANWINQIRGTTVGALVLGKGFLGVDLIRYTVGVLVGAALNKIL